MYIENGVIKYIPSCIPLEFRGAECVIIICIAILAFYIMITLLIKPNYEANLHCATELEYFEAKLSEISSNYKNNCTRSKKVSNTSDRKTTSYPIQPLIEQQVEIV